MKIEDEEIVVELALNSTIDKVWTALTNLDEMKQWFFENINSFTAEIGFKTQFEVNVEDKTFTHLWTITELVPLRKLTLNWKYKEYSGDSLVTFELTEKEQTTQLKLSLVVLENFPSQIPEFTRESCIQGWHYFLNERLKNYLKD